MPSRILFHEFEIHYYRVIACHDEKTNASFCYNTKIQKALLTQEPNLWGGGNGCFPFYCPATLFFSLIFLFFSSWLPVKYFGVSTYNYACPSCACTNV